MTHPTVADLRPVDLFDKLTDDEVQLWADAAELCDYPAGTVIESPEQETRGLHLLLDGIMDALIVHEDRVEPAGEHLAPTWLGAIAALTEGPVGVRMQCQTECRIATIPTERFVELTLTHRAVFHRIMRIIRPVMNRIQGIEQNRERLASLGTMAAGLAHELNNPAAAAKRSSAELADALDVLGSTIDVFVHSGVERAEAEALVEMKKQALATSCELYGTVGAVDASDAEDELLDALEDMGVAEAWKLAGPLASAHVDRAWLERVQELAGPATRAALEWVASSISARELVSELAESTDRMSSLVTAIKSYAYMDRGELVEVDIHEGIETTLKIMGHKLKNTHIKLERNYDKSLPRLTIRGPEMNQVWTNLIHNAIQALGDSGTLTITTHRDSGDCAVVEIGDDGPGIPAEIQERIFDPFFTTKDVGNGTGLGLDTARRIVSERHRGTLSVESEPGHTVFQVWLPIENTAR